LSDPFHHSLSVSPFFPFFCFFFFCSRELWSLGTTHSFPYLSHWNSLPVCSSSLLRRAPPQRDYKSPTSFFPPEPGIFRLFFCVFEFSTRKSVGEVPLFVFTLCPPFFCACSRPFRSDQKCSTHPKTFTPASSPSPHSPPPPSIPKKIPDFAPSCSYLVAFAGVVPLKVRFLLFPTFAFFSVFFSPPPFLFPVWPTPLFLHASSNYYKLRKLLGPRLDPPLVPPLSSPSYPFYSVCLNPLSQRSTSFYSLPVMLPTTTGTRGTFWSSPPFTVHCLAPHSPSVPPFL